MLQRVHMIVYGDVTGVGFRSWIMKEANELDLKGWVRNTENRDVEIVVEGERGKLIEFISRCNEGPETSWVERVDSRWGDAKGDYNNFCVR